MAYSKIRQPKLSDVIEQQLEFLILEGTLRPGEKLPPERELAKQFDVSRPSLREAIQRLEAKGLLLRRQGGGTFVQNSLWQSFSDPLVELLSDHPESQFDLLETRHALEGIAAYYAALRSTDEDRVRIRELHQAIERAQLRRRIQRRCPVSNCRHRSSAQRGAPPSATLHGAHAGPERSSEF